MKRRRGEDAAGMGGLKEEEVRGFYSLVACLEVVFFFFFDEGGQGKNSCSFVMASTILFLFFFLTLHTHVGSMDVGKATFLALGHRSEDEEKNLKIIEKEKK